MKTTKRLTDLERRTIKGMVDRKDRIQDVAYFFGVSPATVHGIKTNKDIDASSHGPIDLPPKGPYLLVAKEGYAKVQAKAAQVDQAEAALAAADEIVNQLKQLVAVFQRRRDNLATGAIYRTSEDTVALVN